MDFRDMYDLHQYSNINAGHVLVSDSKGKVEWTPAPIKMGDVIDYKGDLLRIEDAVWCEYDKKWCHRDEAIWVDYQGFWTTPEYSKPGDYDSHPTFTDEDVRKMKEFFGDLSDARSINREEEKTVAVKWYKKGKLE